MNPERAAKKALRQKAREERKYERMSAEEQQMHDIAQELADAGNKSNVDKLKNSQTKAISDYHKSRGAAEGTIISPAPSFEKPLDKPAAIQPERFVLQKVDSNLPNQVESTREPSGLKAPVEYVDTTLTHVPNIMAPNKAVSTKSDDTKKDDVQLSLWEQIMADRRDAIKQDKTDAVKMQKYYALTDALKSLGDMAGIAVGGAIGGNAIDSAPETEKYKPSRGYLDAIEKAKKANDRLRELDNEEFKLAYSKAQRDEERAYNEKVRDEERKYRAELMRLESELRQAEKAGDREAEEKFRLKVLELTQAHEEKLKSKGLNTIQAQYDLYHPKQQIRFDNGTGIEISDADYKGMYNFFSGKQFGNETIDETNFGKFLRENPQLVNDYLKVFGKGFMNEPNGKQANSNNSLQQMYGFNPSSVVTNTSNEAQSDSTSNGDIRHEDYSTYVNITNNPTDSRLRRQSAPIAIKGNVQAIEDEILGNSKSEPKEEKGQQEDNKSDNPENKWAHKKRK